MGTLLQHERQAILDYVENILKTKDAEGNYPTIAKEFVKVGFSTPSGIEKMPAILIFHQTEPAEEYTQAPRELMKNLFLTIELIASGDDERHMIQLLNCMCIQVEERLAIDDSLGCTADDIVQVSNEFQFEGNESESPVGSLRMGYKIRYRTLAPRFQGELDDFEQSYTIYDIAGNDQDDATDVIDYPQD